MDKDSENVYVNVMANVVIVFNEVRLLVVQNDHLMVDLP